MNVIDQSGILAISTRLQRLADQIRKEGQEVYRLHGIDFEPKWFPVIYTLHHKPLLSVVEIANEIGYAHPSTISLLKELEAKKLIQSRKDKTDTRKRMIQLSDKGRQLVTRMLPVWSLIAEAITDMTNTSNNLLRAISEVELQMEQHGFLDRAKALMDAKNV